MSMRQHTPPAHFGRLIPCLILLALIIALPGASLSAQDADTCPADIALAVSRSATVCANVDLDDICYANGTVTAELRAGYDDYPPFTQIGDQLTLHAIRVVRTESEGVTLGAARMSILGSYDRARGLRSTVWLFGDTVVANNVPEAPEVEVVTNATSPIRTRPSSGSEIVAVAPVNSFLVANGYSTDAEWIRVFVPNMQALGWVSVATLDPVSFRDLSMIDNSDLTYAPPFTFMYLITGKGDAPCPGAFESGMLIQAANERNEAFFLINNAIVSVFGTAFVQASPGGTLDVSVLQGAARVTTDLVRWQSDGLYTTIPVGSRSRIPLDERGLALTVPLTIEPYDAAVLATLPISLLPSPVTAVQPPTATPDPSLPTATPDLVQPTATPDLSQPTATPDLSQPTATAVFGLVTNTPSAPNPGETPQPTLPNPPTLTPSLTPSMTFTPSMTPTVTFTPTATADLTCVREARDRADLYAGAGTFFEVVGTVISGTALFPVGQATDPDGAIWVQLFSGGWMRLDNIREIGLCAEIPVVQLAPPPPENLVRLETCEPDNGPIREGQEVTFRFTPPGFLTMGEAVAAIRVDPGRIEIDTQALSVQATEPLQITRTSVVRSFFATWTATPGTHRVIGTRLAYSVACDFTVPNE